MKIILIFVSLFIVFTLNCFSQTTIKGVLISENNKVGNVHIVNINNSYGTVSNDFGEFELLVNINDTLFFSSIEYTSKKLKITTDLLKNQPFIVQLEPILNELKEIFLKGLTGNLAFDSRNIPNDTLPKHNFLFKMSDLNKNLGLDTHGFKPAPFAGPFKPLPATAVIPDFQLERELKLKRELAKKKNFPINIRKDLGIQYFTQTLKIPQENIDHFLAFCEYRDVINLYYKKNMLELIEILKEESLSYNSIKN